MQRAEGGKEGKLGALFFIRGRGKMKTDGGGGEEANMALSMSAHSNNNNDHTRESHCGDAFPFLSSPQKNKLAGDG